MAKYDRCEICDYSEALGSGLAGTNPGQQGRVRRHGDGLLCDTCSREIHETIYMPHLKEDGEVEHKLEEES